MARKKPNTSRRSDHKGRKRPPPQAPHEPRTVEAATIGWTVTVSTVVLCEIGAVLAHLLALANPGATAIPVLRDLLLFAAAAVGLISLCLLPIVYRLRAVKPPLGFTVFAAAAAVAPVVALIVRALRT